MFHQQLFHLIFNALRTGKKRKKKDPIQIYCVFVRSFKNIRVQSNTFPCVVQKFSISTLHSVTAFFASVIFFWPIIKFNYREISETVVWQKWTKIHFISQLLAHYTDRTDRQTDTLTHSRFALSRVFVCLLVYFSLVWFHWQILHTRHYGICH